MESRQLSAATKRAMGYPAEGKEWFCGFTYTDVKGIGYEEGVHRRDPSSVLCVDGVYYVWYTKSIGAHFGKHSQSNAVKLFPWDFADIFYATSEDGINWVEQGAAVKRGVKGTFDSRTVCTPDVLEHDGKYYLVYQCQAHTTFYNGKSETVGLAIADNPNGPWKKIEKDILVQMDAGDWFGTENDYNSGHFEGVVHDPSLFFYNNKFYLYYKCSCSKRINNQTSMKHSGPDTRWGVATADSAEGPYTHSPFNPITNSGHETMLWHYDGGIAALLNRDGPEKDTIQYAKDGVNFEVMSHVNETPQAGGACREFDEADGPLAGVRWGLCHCDERTSVWNYITRFDTDFRHSYAHPIQYPKNNCRGIGND